MHPNEIHNSFNSKDLERLLKWFWQAGRDMPWRKTTDPYKIWLSETMLQQTQVETVKPFWLKFISKYPTLKDLASADLQEVLTLWSGLGYYRRARHFHAASRVIVGEHGGKVPEDVGNLRGLPGVGRYTAGAVASIAFGAPVPVVDGNVIRVLARLTANDRDISNSKNVDIFWGLAEQMHVDLAKFRCVSRNPNRHLHGDLNEALMELGAMVCTPPPTSPSCLLCPLRSSCLAFEQGRQGELPVKTKRAKTPVVRVVAVVVTRGNEVLLMQRPREGLWGDMWEFPVIEVSAKAQGLQSLGLMASKEIGVRLKEVVLCGKVRHQLTHRLFEYTVVRAVVQGRSDVIRRPAPYRHVRWEPWPLSQSPPFPRARVVHKIAAIAGDNGAL